MVFLVCFCICRSHALRAWMPRFEVVMVAGHAYIPLKKYEANPGLSYGQAMACSALFFPLWVYGTPGQFIFFLGTHACPASLVPLREFTVFARGLVWEWSSDCTTSWVLSGGLLYFYCFCLCLNFTFNFISFFIQRRNCIFPCYRYFT